MPVIGECPYDNCDESLWIAFDEENLELPMFYRDDCEECKREIWTKLSRVSPESYTQEDFYEKFEINEETKLITLKEHIDGPLN